MTTISKSSTIGYGSAESSLSTDQMREIVSECLSDITPCCRVLAIIPDRTRDDNTHLLFPLAAQALRSRRAAAADILVAQGTHPPMSESDKLAKIRIGSADRAAAGVDRWCGLLFDHGR